MYEYFIALFCALSSIITFILSFFMITADKLSNDIEILVTSPFFAFIFLEIYN